MNDEAAAMRLWIISVNHLNVKGSIQKIFFLIWKNQR